MTRLHNGSAVPRHLVFALSSGAFVVQWVETRVQDLTTGASLPFSAGDYARALTDSELEGLRVSGHIEAFNPAYVWLYALPEDHRFPELRVQETSRDRLRAYYLNTMLPEAELGSVQSLLETLGFAGEYTAVSRGELVSVFGDDEKPFAELKDAENVQRQLASAAPAQFEKTVIAFIEAPAQTPQPKMPRLQTWEMVDLATILASQSDRSLTEGKRALLVCAGDPRMPAGVLAEMGMETRVTASAEEAFRAAEDAPPDVLVTELQLPDLHAWEMLARLRDIPALRDMLTVVLADEGASPEHHALGLNVAQVNVFLAKPYSAARLRLSLWMAARERSTLRAED